MQCCATCTFSVTYEDTDVGESCKKCWCCTTCSTDCSRGCEGRKEEESEDEAAVRILGLNTDVVAQVELVRSQLVMEAEALYARSDTDSDDDGVNLDDEYSEEEGESGS